MRKFIVLLCSISLFQACFWHNDDDDGFQHSNSLYEPVTLPRTEFEATISLFPARTVNEAGKIYIKGNLLFINEKKSGFHVFDNTDPANPINKAFISIPKATDLAIRNNIIYAHHIVDLVAIQYDLTNNNLAVLHREKDVFPQLTSPDGFSGEFFNNDENKVIIGYILKE